MTLSSIRVALSFVVSGALLVISSPVNSITLHQAYIAALVNDPVYKANFYEYELAKENVNIGRAGLLPNISLSYSGSRNSVDNDVASGSHVTTTHPHYLGRTLSLQVRQSLLNADSVIRYQQSLVQSAQAEQQYQFNRNEVAVRVVGAYIDVLFAEDQAELAQAERDTYLEQHRVNLRRFEKGEGTKTDMIETNARLDIAESRLIDANSNTDVARTSLFGVIGSDPGTLSRMDDQIGNNSANLNSFEHLRTMALTRSNEIAVARLAVENAKLEISRSHAAHLPKIDMVAGYTKGDNETINTYGQASVNRSFGIQLNVPIYSGGAMVAATRQAVAGRERAQADLDLRTNKLVTDLRRDYDELRSSAQKIYSLNRAVESSRSLINAIERSIKGGERINLDLLVAKQQLFTTKRDLLQARYSSILASLRVLEKTSIIEDDDIRKLSMHFY